MVQRDALRCFPTFGSSQTERVLTSLDSFNFSLSLLRVLHPFLPQNFRKEALYRELVSYKRQLSRAQGECENLRAQRVGCEVRLSRVEMGWREVREEAGRVLGGLEEEGEDSEGTSLARFRILLEK